MRHTSRRLGGPLTRFAVAVEEHDSGEDGTSYTTDFIAYGRPEGGYGTEIGNRTVSRSYFTTMKVPVLRGRAFSAEDREGSTPVLVINEALATSYFKGEDPVGQRITFAKVITPTSTRYTIIGVVGN